MKRYLQGHFLVAAPKLTDPNFIRTVVFMIQHDADGALGVVLNRPLPQTVGELWEQVCEDELASDRPIYWGGPVGGPILLLHTDVTASQDEIRPGLYLAADRAQLESVLRDDDHEYRLFVGYAGWAPGQLESEIEEGSWFVVDGDTESVFAEPEGLWERAVSAVGGAALAPLLGSIPVPDDPSCN